MAQHDFNIANQGFPAFRSDLNNALSAINSSQSGTSRPSGAVAGTIWLDTTNATNPTLKFFDGTDDISLATIDYSANTVNWLDSTVSADLVGDTTPQLGGQLDVNGFAIGDGTLELLKFSETASAVNELTITNSATGNAPELSSTGDDTNIDIKITPKGSGNVVLDGLKYPNADGTADQILKTDGSGNLSFVDASGGGITETDMWRFTADISNTIADPIQNNLERVDNASFAKIGTGMSVSSGIWTFPSTGLYRIDAFCGINTSGTDVRLEIEYSGDSGSTWDELSRSWSQGSANTSYCTAFVNITNTSTQKLKFVAYGAAGTDFRGDTDQGRNGFIFIRLGDSQ